MQQAPPQRAHTRARTSLTPDDLAAATEMLDRVERSRREQLAALPDPRDAVARAHRASVQRILDAVCAARRQVTAGTYGTCVACGSSLEGDALRARPWSIWCPLCDHR